MSPETGLRDVSDTALWVAVYRAHETERRRPLFRDPYARMLAGERGERIAGRMRYGRQSWAVVVRTAGFDRLVLEAVRVHGVASVLNLAAGLDSRPYRLELPAELRWVEADLPGVLDYKARRLAGERPRCRLERLPLDLTDADARRRALGQVGAGAGPTLVLTEGLLVYLDREDVAALARDLAKQPAFDWWLLGLAGPLFLEWSTRTVGSQLSAAGVSMRFAPEEGPDFFRPLEWQPAEVGSAWEEARRSHRDTWLMRLAWTISSPRQRQPYRDLVRHVLLRRERQTSQDGGRSVGGRP